MEAELKTLPIANKELHPTVSFVLAMVLATYLTACSTVAMNQADEVRTAEARAAAELAIKERAEAEQAMAARTEAEKAAAERAAIADARAKAERAEVSHGHPLGGSYSELAKSVRDPSRELRGSGCSGGLFGDIFCQVMPDIGTQLDNAHREGAPVEQAMAAQAEAERKALAKQAIAARAEAQRKATAVEQKMAKEKPPRPATQPTIPTKPVSSFESYSVTVSANEQLTIPGPPGELRVWIGISSKAPRNQSRMSTETIELGTVGETAKVKPFALGIDVDPKESICEKIDPTGSEVRFKLTQIKTGVFTVGADVELYNSNDCTGTAVPKSAKSVSVNVVVDKDRVASDSIEEMLKRTWKAFLDFWDKLLLIIFGLFIFLLRKKLSKLFGFESKE